MPSIAVPFTKDFSSDVTGHFNIGANSQVIPTSGRWVVAIKSDTSAMPFEQFEDGEGNWWSSWDSEENQWNAPNIADRFIHLPMPVRSNGANYRLRNSSAGVVVTSYSYMEYG